MKRRSFIREIVFLSAAPALWLPRKTIGQPAGWGVSDLSSLVAPAASASFTIGDNSSGGTTGSSTRIIAGGPWLAANTGTISSLYFYISTAATANAAAAIYADSSGSVGALVAQSTGTASVTSTAAWCSVSLSASIVSGNSYWLAVWGDVSLTYYYASDAAYSVKLGQNTGFHEFNPFTLNSTSPPRRLKIYGVGA